MAEAAVPYTFGQDESASPQYDDPEKSSVTEKVYDSGFSKTTLISLFNLFLLPSRVVYCGAHCYHDHPNEAFN